MQDENAAKIDPAPANDSAAPQAGAVSEADPGARLAALEGELAARGEELAAFRESAMRQLAEAQNLRRRAEMEGAEARRFGAASLARDILVVADNLRRALDAAAVATDTEAGGTQITALRQGVEMTGRELANVLKRHGVTPIDPMGEKFDPTRHQAMFEVEAAEVAPGTVVQVVQAGYLVHDRLLRPALVGVAKTPRESTPPAAAEGSAAESSAAEESPTESPG